LVEFRGKDFAVCGNEPTVFGYGTDNIYLSPEEKKLAYLIFAIFEES